MSVENAKNLVQKLTGNDELKNRFKSAGEDGFEALAAAEGFPCSVSDYQTAVKEMAQQMDFKKDSSGDAGVQSGTVVVISVVVV